MVRFTVRYKYAEKGDLLFVRFAFKLPRELANAAKSQLEKKHGKRVILTPHVQEGKEDKLTLEV